MNHHRYKQLGVLGEGAMGQVWMVEDASTGRRLAMKVLAADQAPSAAALLQFKQEFRMMTQLRHPHCCEAYDFGTLADGRPFFTMELVEGHGLDELLPLDPQRTREVLAQVLLALDAVHQLGLVHRDIKSQNVRVRPDGVVKLMDFGLMEHAGRSEAPIKGTLAYIAPEAIKRGPVDLRADLYALGCLAYELLVGKPPFSGERPIDLLRAHVSDEAPPPSWHRPEVGAQLDRVVMKLLAKDPLDRYQSAFEVLDDLGYQAPARFGGTLLTSPLMGRQAELDVLHERLLRVAERQPGGVVFLQGGSGIGKSRLLEEFRFQAMLEQVPIVEGRPYEQGNPPYGLLVQVLQGLLPELREHVPDALAAAAPAIAKQLPALTAAAGLEDVAPAPDLDMAGEKLRMQAAVVELLHALARKRPFVLALDDWQWADPLSTEVWQAVMVQLAPAPVQFVLASRYAPEGEPAWMGTVTLRSLAPLETLDVERMVTAMLGSQEVEHGFVHQIGDLAEGNPFFVERLLEHLVQTGAIRIERGSWLTDITLSPEVVPRTLAPMLLGKLAPLSDAAKHLANVAAVRGRALDVALLSRVADLGDEEVIEALDELLIQRIFHPLEEGAFRFAQEHYQEFVYAELNGEEREALHGAVAHALVEGWGDRPLEDASFELVTDVAHHAIAAGDADLTVRFALEAARRHAHLYALVPAERLLKAGLQQLPRLGSQPATRLAYLVALGDVRRGLGNMHGAKEAYMEAVPLAEAQEPRPERLLGQIWASVGLAHRIIGNWSEGLAACQKALPLLESSGARAEAVEARLTMSRVLLFRGEAQQGLVEAEAALALARELDDPRCLAEALAHVGHMLITFDPSRYQEGMRCLNQTLAILPGLGDKSGLRNAYLLLGGAQAQLGDFPAARGCFERSLLLSEEVGAQAGSVGALVNLGLVALEQGEFATALARARDAYDRAVRLQHTYLIGVSMVVEGVALGYRGQPGTGVALLAQVQAQARALKNAYLEMLSLCWLGELGIFMGDLDAALEASNALGELMARTGNSEHESRYHVQRCEIRVRRKELPEALTSAEAAMKAATAAHADGDLVRALEARARVAMACEQWAIASRAAERGLGIAQRIGAQHHAALLHGILGEVALATGNIRAERHFVSMARLAEGLGVEPLLAEALFGQAAARPYHEAAGAFVESARMLIERQAQGLDPAARERFCAVAERARILRGNAIEFSLPRAIQRHTGSLIERIQNLADA